jgi:hypothetical protein
MFILPDCFYNALFAAPDVASYYSFDQCAQYILPVNVGRECNVETQTLSYSPPYIYSYQCSSKVIINYASVYILMFIMASLIPLMKLGLKLYYDTVAINKTDSATTPTVLQRRVKRFVERLLPSYCKQIRTTKDPKVTTIAQKIEKPQSFVLFSKLRLTVKINSYVTIIATFGALFPPLAIVGCFTIFIITYFEELSIGWLLSETRAKKYFWYEEQLNHEAENVEKSSNFTLWSTLTVSSFFYGYIVFDTMGDTAGWIAALPMAVLLFSFPLLLYVFITCYREVRGSKYSKGRSKALFDCTDICRSKSRKSFNETSTNVWRSSQIELGDRPNSVTKENEFEMSCFVSSIPKDVLYFLADYLLPVEEQQKQCFKYNYDLRNFVNTNKKYFGEWKKKTRVMTLMTSDAEKFVSSLAFRSTVLSMIDDPLEQLELQFLYLDRTCVTPVSLIFQGGVRKFTAEQCNINEFSIPCGEIIFRNCNIQNLHDCPPFRKLELLDSIVAEDSLNSVAILDEGFFASTHPPSLHSLRSLKSLKLCHLDFIIDVSCLRNIPKLEFVGCDNIRDIRSLVDILELAFTKCNGISDVSSLGRIYTLKLWQCNNIRDVSALGQVHHLEIAFCREVTDVSALGTVYELQLTACPQVRDFSALKSIRELHLGNVSKTDISGLENVDKLFLSSCNGVSDMSRLKTIQVLDIERCLDVQL